MLLKLQTGIGVPPVSESIVRKYTWGLDLAGLSGSVGQGSALPSQNAGLGGPASLEGAGGIGGLLAMQQPPQIRSDLNCVYLYDANGNVGQLVEWAADLTDPPGRWDPLRLAARYEYDPYGQPTTRTGHYADHNPFRFSTKAFDDETGLGYWGYRYYSAALGRWISRDPAGEPGFREALRAVAGGASVPRNAKIVGGPNRYGYVYSSPTNVIDAYGLESTKVAIECSPVRRSAGLITLGYHCSIVATCGGEGFRWQDLGWAKNAGGIEGDDPNNPENARKDEEGVGGDFLDDPGKTSWRRYDVTCKKEECSCELVKCFREAMRKANFTTYHPLGPNSNTFAAAMLAKCGCSVSIWGWYPTPFWGPVTSIPPVRGTPPPGTPGTNVPEDAIGWGGCPVPDYWSGWEWTPGVK